MPITWQALFAQGDFSDKSAPSQVLSIHGGGYQAGDGWVGQLVGGVSLVNFRTT